jgi:hypothetical protein
MAALMRSVAVTILIASSAAAQSGVTGTWSGTYAMSIQVGSCQNKTFTWSGNATVTFLQSGASVTGRIDLTNFTFLNNNCTTTSAELTKVVFGTDGSTLTLAVPNDPNGWQFSGPVGALQLSDVNGLTGSLSLTRVSGVPAADFTGSWSGNYNFSDVCPSGSGNKSYTGAFTLALTQSGDTAGGVLTMTNVPLYDQNCSTLATLTQQLAVAGSVSGSTFTGAAFDPAGTFDFPFTATIGSSGITGSAAGASPTTTTGTFTLTQSSAQVPASDFSGRFEGTYAESDNGLALCFNVGTVNFQDAAALDLVQAGSAVSGALILENTLSIVSDGFGSCAVIEGGEQALPIYGTINNGVVSFTVPLGASAVQAFQLNLAGDTITGAMQDSFSDVMQFSVTRAAAAPPAVRRRAVKP